MTNVLCSSQPRYILFNIIEKEETTKSSNLPPAVSGCFLLLSHYFSCCELIFIQNMKSWTFMETAQSQLEQYTDNQQTFIGQYNTIVMTYLINKIIYVTIYLAKFEKTLSRPLKHTRCQQCWKNSDFTSSRSFNSYIFICFLSL